MEEEGTPDKADDKAGASAESPLDALARAAESVDSETAATEAAAAPSAAAAEGTPKAPNGDAAAVPATGGHLLTPPPFPCPLTHPPT